MGRDERWFWFEWICRLRDAYRAAEHVTVVTIDEVIALAEQMLVAGTGAADVGLGAPTPPGTPGAGADRRTAES